MLWLISLMGFCVATLIGAGAYLELRPRHPPEALPQWLRSGVLANFLVYGLAMAGILYLSIDQALAQEAVAGTKQISEAVGLALIGIGLPTGLAAIGAGLALGPVGSAALAVIAEKPEMFGRTLIYLGLAEGIAIYGLVMSILLLGKI
jgi:V/A-type H+/Na+-transporting ATPase subunit K